MKSRLRALLFVATVATFAVGIQGQQPPSATGSIDGIVLSGNSSAPLDAVDVTLVSPGTRGETPRAFKTLTDGKFHLDNIPSGNYQLRIQKLGYFNSVTTTAAYLINVPITVAAQQQIKNLEFHLIQGGVIKGRVLDTDGKPLPGVTMNVMSQEYSNEGNPRLWVYSMNVLSTGGRPDLTAGPPTTDDKGEYRLFWLAPGKYYVRADYTPTSTTPTTGPPRRATTPTAVVSTYFPSTNDVNQAGALTLSPGGEITADITIRKPASVTVSGRIVESGTMPPRASRTYNLFLFPRDPQVPTERIPRAIGTVSMGAPGNTGSFSIPFVTPGQYYLSARYQTVGNAQIPIDVTRDNIDGLTLNVDPPASLKLQVSVQGDTSLQRNTLPSMGLRPEFVDTPWAPTNISADGSGELNVAPGRYLFQSLPLPGDAYIADVRQGAKSVLREWINHSPNAEPLQITVNTAGGRIDGDVRDAGGKLVSAFVKAVSMNRERLPLSTQGLGAPAEASGHFAVRNLPPGDYKLFAFESIPANADANAEFMAKFDALGTRVTVPASGKATQNLKLIPRETTTP